VSLRAIWQLLRQRLWRERQGIKSFQAEADRAGGVTSGLDRGIKIVPTEKVVGSVSRWQNLRSDFFYRQGQAMTQRFHRVGQAMKEGKALPPLELYKLKRRPGAPGESPVSEYYVVDGHHRVAMAKKLGQDFLDAHVTEFRGASPPDPAKPAAAEAPEAPKAPDSPT
jgi:hypothetical protein